MRMADLSVQKLIRSTNSCACGKVHSMDSELIYCGYRDVGKRLTERLIDYKLLYLTDDPLKTGIAGALGQNVTTVVLNAGTDVSALFALADGINCVAAYGGNFVLETAKYFATVRKIRGVALVSSCDGAPLLNRRATVKTMGEWSDYPVKDFNFIFYDGRGVDKESLKDAYISLAVCALSVLEARFAEAVLGRPAVCGQIMELAYDVLLRLCTLGSAYDPATELFEQSLRYAYCLREGFPSTESAYIMDGLKTEEKYSAFKSLADVYYTFFRYGGMRRYTAADYAARIKAAAKIKGMSELDVSLSCHIPSVEELNGYLVRFGECRARFVAFADDLKRRGGQILDCFLSLGGKPVKADVGAKIYTLPEVSGVYGIISLMRDFGLLEKRIGG